MTSKYSRCDYLAKKPCKNKAKSSKTQYTRTRVRDAVLKVTSAPMEIQRCQCRTIVKVKMNIEMNTQIGINVGTKFFHFIALRTNADDCGDT